MNDGVDVKRVGIFLAFAFGIAWVIGLIIFLTGGLVNSPVLVPALRLTLATVLLAVGYMWAPALAHVLTRLLTREGWHDTWLRPHFKQGWRYWLAACQLAGYESHAFAGYGARESVENTWFLQLLEIDLGSPETAIRVPVSAQFERCFMVI
ncbi:hypothetical protein [Candidatus Amarolinea aalborgensis]|uniref:hypothetical protein n=1 Tax=Candidatus Amarolinea aalborgensis TaxID=2249329 RepID=UPI003BF990EC